MNPTTIANTIIRIGLNMILDIVTSPTIEKITRKNIINNTVPIPVSSPTNGLVQ